MSYDDPNRESVGLAPIWTGAEEPPPEGDTPEPDSPEPEAAKPAARKATKRG